MKMRQIFTDIYDDSEWLIDLVENLLSISRIENGQMNLHLSMELTGDVIDEALHHVNRNVSEHHVVVQPCSDVLIALTPIEFKLLSLLARNTGKVLTHTYITQNIWGRSWDNDIASLRVFMVTLRKKLEPSPDSPAFIQTHVGIGYRMQKVE